MSSPKSDSFLATFSLDANDLDKSTINTIRATLGIGGLVAVIIGAFIVFAPDKSAIALAWIFGLYFLIAGIAYIGLGVFSRGISGGSRTLDIILGLLFVVGGILVLTRPAESAAVIGIFVGVFIGILWIVEGVVTLAQSGGATSRGWAIFFGILSILAGIVLLFSPLWGAAFLFWFGGIALLVLGVVQIIRAFTFGRGRAVATA